jgi:hypothetical protein
VRNKTMPYQCIKYRIVALSESLQLATGWGLAATSMPRDPGAMSI